MTLTVCPVPDCPHLEPCPTHTRTWVDHNGWAWQRQRARILARDHYQCECGARATTVHHVQPLNAGGTDNPNNLRAICRACHHHAHNGGGG